MLLAPVSAAGQGISPHGAPSLPQECVDCHTTNTWSPARADMAFDHAQTGFPLDGQHAQVPCSTCHLDLRFDVPKADPTDCGACHLDVHLDAFTQPCASCHTSDSFRDVEGLDVHGRTSFPLTGAHLQVSCESCHQEEERGPFSAVDPACMACHRDDYLAAPGIDHDLLGFPDDCTGCHNTLAWASTPDFEHAIFARGFALVGAHDRAPCSACHVVPGFETLFTPQSQDDCVACHRAGFDSEHGGDGYPTECLLCHTTDSWSGDFEHQAASSGFALLGAHERAPCTACHTLPDLGTLFTTTDATDCTSCHQQDFEREHQGSGFSTSCLDCHTTETWRDADFDHATASGGFLLIGAHTSLLCSSCHLPGNEELRVSPPPSDQTDCVACHREDYDRVHTGTSFSAACTDCHDADSWMGARFDHESTANGFRLLDPHDQAPCSACHVQPGNTLRFSPQDDQDCIACHTSDFNLAHNADQYPTTCLTCHAPNTWGGAAFDHGLYFPIYTGAHRPSIWGSCGTCHTNPADYTVFTCLSCHEHRQSATDGEHDEVSGYAYESQRCYDCHMDGTS